MAGHVCPVWVGYFLANPLRKLVQNPRAILSAYISEGMKIIDIGSAMGFFSIPMAKITGPSGKVICIDLQQKMLDRLKKRAEKANVISNIELRNCTTGSLMINDLKEEVDFALAFAVLHEVNDAAALFSEVYSSLKPGGKFLIAEPKGHVDEHSFEATIKAAKSCGFKIIGNPDINNSLTAVLLK